METAAVIISLLVLFIGLPIAILMIKDRIDVALFRRRYPPEKLKEMRRLRRQRLLEPDWVFYEQHLERPVPEALRDLYNDPNLMRDGCLELDDSGEVEIQPIDKQGLLDTRGFIGHDVVAIASNGFGDPIYLRPGKLEPDAMYVTYHDGEDTEMLAPNVDDFLRQLREHNLPIRNQNLAS